MAEYIDREDLLELYDPCEIERMGIDPETANVPFLVVRQNIIDMIPANVKPVVHGEWIAHRGNWQDEYECSVCRRISKDGGNYCGNCGARMVKEDD